MAVGPTLLVTDETTTPELVEYLMNLNASAKRCQCVVGSEAYPSAWDRMSARCDAVLGEIVTRIKET